MFPVLFAIPRVAGWMAEWKEMLEDPEQKITRPRQIYVGYDQRAYLPAGERGAEAAARWPWADLRPRLVQERQSKRHR